MEPIVLFLLFSGLLIIVSMVAAYIPIVSSLKDGGTHMMIAVSTGIFIGLLMFMLLPEGIEEAEEGGIDVHYGMMVLVAGFLVIMVIDQFMKQRHLKMCGCDAVEHRHDHDDHDHDHEHHHDEKESDTHGHRIVSMSSFVGLSIHAACDGLALAAMFMAGEEIGILVAIGFCIHKFAELFTLSSTMLLSDIGKKRSLTYLGLFSLITPIAGIIFFLLFGQMEVEGMLGVPLLFASGTLLYVVACNMIPESFHRTHGWKSTALVLVGVALMFAFALLFPHAH